MSLYRKMNRKEYVQALHERLEPASACDLIYTQFKERTQKAGEVYDLYLRDKYNLFIRENAAESLQHHVQQQKTMNHFRTVNQRGE